MKKSLFGFSAKIAMAVLAVCSVVLTSCYQKPVPTPDEDPVYYVTGTVYDATTSAAINATVTVDGKAVSVNNGSFLQEIAGPGSVTVAAEAAGYVSVSRTVQVVAVGKNQVSVTSADIAMLPVGVELPENEVVEGSMSLADLTDKFGFPEGTEIDEEGFIHVHEALALESHDGHSLAHTKLPWVAKFNALSGYITDFESKDAVVAGVMDIVTSAALQTVNAGSKYADFKATACEETLNESGEKCLLSATVCHTFTQWFVTYVFDGAVYTANAVKAEDTTVMPKYDSHDSHDSHDRHDSHDSHDSHDGHDNHGGTNAGGGEIVEE